MSKTNAEMMDEVLGSEPEANVIVIPNPAGLQSRETVPTGDICSLNMRDPDCVDAVLTMETGESVGLWEARPEHVDVVALQVRRVEIIDEKTGEARLCDRTTFLSADNVAYTTLAPGVARLARVLNGMLNDGKVFCTPVRVTFSTKKTRSGDLCFLAHAVPGSVSNLIKQRVAAAWDAKSIHDNPVTETKPNAKKPRA